MFVAEIDGLLPVIAFLFSKCLVFKIFLGFKYVVIAHLLYFSLNKLILVFAKDALNSSKDIYNISNDFYFK